MKTEITFTEGPTPEPARIDTQGFPRQSGMTYEELMASISFPSLDTPVEARIRQALLAKGKKV